jgi:hypothetical protein
MSDTCDNIGTYDFTCILQNEGFNVELTFTEGDPAIPIDLTLYDEIKLDIKDDFGNIVKRKELGDGLSIHGTDDNVLRVSFAKADTLVLTRPSYNYDILFVNALGENWYPIQGSIKIINTITR